MRLSMTASERRLTRSSPNSERAMAHLRIGRLLASQTAPDERDEKIFDVVNQLNDGAALITTPKEREQVAELNLIAGKRAKSAAAYSAALQYFTKGNGLLGENDREQSSRLAFELELNSAECEYLTSRLASAEERLSVLSRRTSNLVDTAAVACLRMTLYTTLDRSDRAVEVGLEYLRRVGVDFSPHPTDDDVRQEYEPALATPWRPHHRSARRSACDTRPRLHRDARGAHADGACGQFHGREPFLRRRGANGKPVGGTRQWRRVVPRLCLARHDTCGRASVISRRAFASAAWASIWWSGRAWTALRRASTRTSDTSSIRGRGICGTELIGCGARCITAQTNGDLTFASFAGNSLTMLLLASGEPLDVVQREAENGLEFTRSVRFGLFADIMTGQLGLVRALRGQTSDHLKFRR